MLAYLIALNNVNRNYTLYTTSGTICELLYTLFYYSDRRYNDTAYITGKEPSRSSKTFTCLSPFRSGFYSNSTYIFVLFSYLKSVNRELNHMLYPN